MSIAVFVSVFLSVFLSVWLCGWVAVWLPTGVSFSFFLAPPSSLNLDFSSSLFSLPDSLPVSHFYVGHLAFY